MSSLVLIAGLQMFSLKLLITRDHLTNCVCQAIERSVKQLGSIARRQKFLKKLA
jgi:hypothetical protein